MDALVTAAKNGDKEAFVQLIRMNKQSLYKAAWVYLRLRNRIWIFQYGKCSMDFRVWCSLLMKMQWISAETDLQD